MAERLERHWSDSKAGRRRSWGGSGCMPPEIAGEFTEGERAALSFVAFQCSVEGTCRRPINKIAQEAGVGATTVRRALRRTRPDELNLLAVEDRTEWGLSNIIRITSQSWLMWMAAGEWRGPADFRPRVNSPAPEGVWGSKVCRSEGA
jgi:hypothetical protein